MTTTWLFDARHDVTPARRAQAKNRGFTAVAVLTLSTGIGATTAIWTLANAILWEPPLADADRLGDGAVYGSGWPVDDWTCSQP